jgi:hypothetical protein
MCYDNEKEGENMAENKKKSARGILKEFSWIYVILAVAYIVAFLLCLAVPQIADKLKEGFGNDIMIGLGATAVVSAIFYLWYFWLAGRIADGKSNGTFYMVLLLLGIGASVVNMLTTKGATLLNIDTIVDIIGLYFLLQVRKED